MKRIGTVYFGILAVLTILIVGVFGWNYYAGPIMKARVRAAERVINKDAIARRDADKAISVAAGLPAKWQSLTFNEDKEILLIAADLAESRQYKVDNYRDPTAVKVAKDIVTADDGLAKADSALRAVHKELGAYYQSYLPTKQARDLAAALRNNENTSRQVKAKRAALKELKSDNYVWGHLAVVVKADGEIMTSIGQADTALRANDYPALQEASSAGRRALADSIDWLQVGELELTNVGVYSKDTADLKRFISKSVDAIAAYEQAAIFLFGNRTDAAALKQAADRASNQLADLRKMAEAQQIGQGYKVWFLAAANRRL